MHIDIVDRKLAELDLSPVKVLGVTDLRLCYLHHSACTVSRKVSEWRAVSLHLSCKTSGHNLIRYMYEATPYKGRICTLVQVLLQAVSILH